MSQGFLKVLYSVVVLSELVVSQSPIIIDLGELGIAAQRLVIILDGELVLFRFIMGIASLVVSVYKIGVEANGLIVIFDRPARLAELGVGRSPTQISFGRFRRAFERPVVSVDGLFEFAGAIILRAFIERVLSFAAVEQGWQKNYHDQATAKDCFVCSHV